MSNSKNRYHADIEKRKQFFSLWIREIGVFILVIGGVLILSGAFSHSYHALLKARWPRIEEIEVNGLRRMERKEILNVLAVPQHANALTLRMNGLAERLEALPWVRSAVVRLDMPGRLVVDIVEREPIAVICAKEFYLMDTQGKLFYKADVNLYSGLLLVTGFSGYDLHENDFLPSESLEALKNLLLALEKVQKWLPVAHISECNWHQEEGFTLYTIQKAIPIRLGRDHFDERLDRLRRVFALLLDRQWWEPVTRINLDYSNRVYIEGNFPIPKGI